jgi:hypothetical protein
MLRLVLLLLYLLASSTSSSTKQVTGVGLTSPPPVAPTADYGAGFDPNG